MIISIQIYAYIIIKSFNIINIGIINIGILLNRQHWNKKFAIILLDKQTNMIDFYVKNTLQVINLKQLIMILLKIFLKMNTESKFILIIIKCFLRSIFTNSFKTLSSFPVFAFCYYQIKLCTLSIYFWYMLKGNVKWFKETTSENWQWTKYFNWLWSSTKKVTNIRLKFRHDSVCQL